MAAIEFHTVPDTIAAIDKFDTKKFGDSLVSCTRASKDDMVWFNKKKRKGVGDNSSSSTVPKKVIESPRNIIFK
jgi:hypothetical protein